MKKTVWIVNKYAMPPQYESRLRSIKFAQYLTEAGYEVIIFGSSIMHNMNLNIITDGTKYVRKQYGSIDFVHINTCMYSKTSRFKRVISNYQFYMRLAKYAKDFKKPDYVISIGGPYIFPNPFEHYIQKNKIPYIKESLDVWPDNFIDWGIFSKRNPIMKLLFMRAKNSSAKANALVYSWYGCYEYLKAKKWDKGSGGPINMKKVYYINNGVDLRDFETYKESYQIDDPDLKSKCKKVIYLGSLRQANNIMQLVYAAEILKDRNDIEFLIYGDGCDREKIIKYTEGKKLSNVHIKDKWIDPKYVPFVISQSDINILNYYSSNFGKYGISSSKMFQYMAAGKPILCNINIFKCPITENKIGIAREFTTSQEYASAILDLLNLTTQESQNLCERSQNTAKLYDYKYLTERMIDILNSVHS